MQRPVARPLSRHALSPHGRLARRRLRHAPSCCMGVGRQPHRAGEAGLRHARPSRRTAHTRMGRLWLRADRQPACSTVRALRRARGVLLRCEDGGRSARGRLRAGGGRQPSGRIPQRRQRLGARRRDAAQKPLRGGLQPRPRRGEHRRPGLAGGARRRAQWAVRLRARLHLRGVRLLRQRAGR